MALTVRRFLAHEWRKYRELRLRALKDAPDSFGSTYEHEVARSDHDWESRLSEGATSSAELPLVALVDDISVGLAWGRVDDRDSSVAHLFQVWVAPEARELGVGRLLLETAIAWAKEQGMRELQLDVTASHPAAPRLYRRAGFVEAGEPEPVRPGSAMLCQPMRLVLQPSVPD